MVSLWVWRQRFVFIWIDKYPCFFRGKSGRKDLYQAPYVWVQFTDPKPNVLINVLCRVYGSNIDFDKKTGRALTRFQIYVEDKAPRATARQARDF
jgi:hypothetical protein